MQCDGIHLSPTTEQLCSDGKAVSGLEQMLCSSGDEIPGAWVGALTAMT